MEVIFGTHRDNVKIGEVRKIYTRKLPGPVVTAMGRIIREATREEFITSNKDEFPDVEKFLGLVETKHGGKPARFYAALVD